LNSGVQHFDTQNKDLMLQYEMSMPTGTGGRGSRLQQSRLNETLRTAYKDQET